MSKIHPIDICNLEAHIKNITLQFGLSVKILEVDVNPFNILFGCNGIGILRVTMRVVGNKLQVKTAYHTWSDSLKKRLEIKARRRVNKARRNY